ncbi:MAG: DUF4160 domain-containing protein [Gammaproteobacteria bacterium]|nr:DUF4160 domain-containing protein [Gammaproteobacteria bacterium]
MPVVARFSHCRVRVNAKDHPPPHFHVLLNDGREAWVTIAELKIVHGKVAVAVRKSPRYLDGPSRTEPCWLLRLRSCNDEQRSFRFGCRRGATGLLPASELR